MRCERKVSLNNCDDKYDDNASTDDDDDRGDEKGDLIIAHGCHG